MAHSSPEGIELGKGSRLVSLDLSIGQEKVLAIKQQERSYSEEDMKTAFNVGFNVGYNDETSPSYLTAEKFIEQFKNK